MTKVAENAVVGNVSMGEWEMLIWNLFDRAIYYK